MAKKGTSFKYTFPVLKAERRDDGLYLLGFASGPEIDKDDERIDPSAILRFAQQIEDRVAAGDPLPYVDAHADDGVLRELGHLMKAWVNEHFHLGVEVRLDEANPASQFLFQQISRGKQYGMSVSGRVIEWADEFVQDLGRSIRTFKNVVLDEISNTTRPAWYPSFGTVLAKSVGSAEDSASIEGDTASMDDELHGDADVAVGDVDPETGDEVVAIIPLDEEAVADEAVADEPAAESADEGDDVDKAGRSISAKNRENLLGLFNSMRDTLASLGVIEGEQDAPAIEPEKSAPESEEVTLDKSVQEAIAKAVENLTAENKELVQRLGEATARIEALESAPRTQLPGAITDETKKAEDDFRAVLSKATPSDKLRLALAAMHGDGVVN